jgi:hypothetical protein
MKLSRLNRLHSTLSCRRRRSSFSLHNPGSGSGLIFNLRSRPDQEQHRPLMPNTYETPMPASQLSGNFSENLLSATRDRHEVTREADRRTVATRRVNTR